MADRAPYAFTNDEEPRWEWNTDEEGLPKGLIRLRPDIVVLSFIGAVTIVLVSSKDATGTISPWVSVAILVASTWLYAVAGSPMSKRSRVTTPAGAVACIVASALATAMMWISSVDILNATQVAGHPVLGWITVLLAVWVANVSHLSAERQTKALWQDEGWSPVDKVVHSTVIPSAWLLSHLGDFKTDRYAMTNGIYPKPDAMYAHRRHFLVDKSHGLLAPLPDDDVEAQSILQGLRDDGYAIEQIGDIASIIRQDRYPSWSGSITFCPAPTRGITASEYYGRMP